MTSGEANGPPQVMDISEAQEKYARGALSS